VYQVQTTPVARKPSTQRHVPSDVENLWAGSPGALVRGDQGRDLCLPSTHLSPMTVGGRATATRSGLANGMSASELSVGHHHGAGQARPT
jgi:hypothetical protein